jgi:hypothetical protein
MLVLDDHGSHLHLSLTLFARRTRLSQFACFHTSHLLQPLDVSDFAPLKWAYGNLVEQRMRHNHNPMDKLDFLEAFPTARVGAFKSQTIRNRLAGTGLYPLDPDRVIQKLHIQLKSPMTPGSRRISSTSSYTFQAPQTSRHLQRHTTAIRKLIDDGRTKSSTPFRLAVQ